MRQVPVPNNNDIEYKSMTASDLIIELQKLNPNTVIMSHDGDVIINLVKDKGGFDIVYLTSVP